MSRVLRSFIDIFGLLNRGRFQEKVDDHLEKAFEELAAQPDEKGEATVTLTFKLTRIGDRVDIKPAVKSKLPEEKGFSSTPLFAVDGGLSTQHPSQRDMFPRDAEERRRERDGA